MISEILEKAVKAALKELKTAETKVILEHPEEFSNGDYSTNIAMVLAKEKKQNPRELAERIAGEIRKNTPKEVERVEVAGPGFINFYLSGKFFTDETKDIVKAGEKFGKTKMLSGQKFLIEHTQPNPFKEFHIGHLMNNAIGESISRIIKENGAEVKDVSYHGDVGLHVAKAIWAIKKQNIVLEKISMEILGKMYSAGNTAYETDENAKKEIEEINKKIYEKSDEKINEIYESGKKISLDYFESLYKKLGSHFDNHFYESETGEAGKKIVEENIGKVFEKSEGAVIFKGEKYGLHTRVFINKDGLPTYEAKELGLAELKRKFFKYDTSITVTANEQDSFFDVVEAAIGEIFPDLKGKLKHISHGVLKLPSGKMSSRTGSIISAESLIEQVKEKVMEKIAGRGFTQEEKDEVAGQVAIGAIRYSILHQSNGKDIIFDFDKSLSFEGDSGPYLQYSYARAKSILRKAEEEGVKEKFEKTDEGESELEKTLYRFPEVVERAGSEYSPHYIATYLIELSSSFNGFYAKNKIVDKNDQNSPYRIALTDAFSIILKNGLNLLGIQAPEKM